MGLVYANPPFSLLAKVLTKIAYEGGRVVMCYYQLARHFFENGLVALQVTLDEIRWNCSRANNSTSCSSIARNI